MPFKPFSQLSNTFNPFGIAEESPGFVGAYDAIPNLAHVYEPERRVLSDYTGALVRLRRSTDNAESDFGYVEATGELDKAAIATWLGAATGYIKTIYDQVGADHLTMATADRQPAYTANAKNGHAGGTWDGSATYQKSDALQCAFTNGGVVVQPYSVYSVAQLATAKVNNGGYVTLFDNNVATPNRCYAGQYPIDTPDTWHVNAGSNLIGAASNDTFNLWSILFSGASSSFHLNNVPWISGNAGTNSLSGLTLGGNFEFAEGSSWRGPICSFIIAQNHSDDDRIAMQDAINSYWDMYAPFELPAGEPDFAIAVIPDSQYFTADASLPVFQATTQWIADNQANIDMTVHIGDIVYIGWGAEWENADTGLATIEAIESMPILYVAGNHDHEENANSTIPIGRPLVQFNNRFGPAHYEYKSWWEGGFYEAGHGENFYYLITLGGQDYIFLNLEFGPRQAVVDWANTILTTYAVRDAIIITHCHLYRDGTRFTTGDPYNPHVLILDGDTNDAEELWTELIKLHGNIVQVICGHDRGITYQVSAGDNGNIVTEWMNGHDVAMLDGNITIIRYYLAQNLVAYTRYTPLTGKIDYSVNLPYKNT